MKSMLSINAVPLFGMVLVTLLAIGPTQVMALDIPSDRPVRLKQSVAPPYPLTAKRAGICGSVTAEIVVNAAGRVATVQIVRAQPQGVFEDVVRSAIEQWEFEVPLGMSPETVQRTTTTIKFILDPEYDAGSTCKAG